MLDVNIVILEIILYLQKVVVDFRINPILISIFNNVYVLFEDTLKRNLEYMYVCM